MSSSRRENTRERNPRPLQSETPREDRPSYRDNRTRPINFPNQIRVRTHIPVQRPCVPALIPTDPFLGPWPSQYPPNYYQQYRVRSSFSGPRPRGSYHQRNETPTVRPSAATSYQSWRNTLWPNPQYLRGVRPPRFPLLVDELDIPYTRGPRGEIPYNNRHSNINPRFRSSHQQQSPLRVQQRRPNPIPPCRTEAEREQRVQNYWTRINRLNPAPGTSTGVRRSAQSRRKKDLKKVHRNQAKPVEDTSSSSTDTLTPQKQYKSKLKKKTSQKTDSKHSSSTDYPTWEDLSHKSSYSESEF